MKREITDGDCQIGPTAQVRLIRSIIVTGILGLYALFQWGGEINMMNKILLFASITSLAIPVWGYLEIRNIVICRAQESRLIKWKAAAFSLHPVMLPVYFIVLPIIGYLAVAWVKHNHAEQPGGGGNAPKLPLHPATAPSSSRATP